MHDRIRISRSSMRIRVNRRIRGTRRIRRNRMGSRMIRKRSRGNVQDDQEQHLSYLTL